MALQSWHRPKTLINPMAVKQLEEKYGFTVSKELSECILLHNGARPKPNTITLKNGEENDVKILLSYNENDPENIYGIIEYFIENYKGKLIPFAADSAGNYYCELEKRIVLWTQSKEIFPVCNNFSQFLESLYEIE